MKWIREEVEIVVYFDTKGIIPICFKYKGLKKKILKVSKIWEERRGFHNCQFFLCLLEENRFAEIKWDIESRKWYLEKY